MLAVALAVVGVPQLQAQSAPWTFGLGTGLGRMSSEGMQGFATASFGPIEYEFDLSPDELKDVMETAFGFATLATNGTWTAKFSYGRIKLQEDGPSGTLSPGNGGFDFSTDVFFDIKMGEFTLGRTVYRSSGNKFSLTPHVGARTTKHELGLDLTIEDGGPTESTVSGDESWVDFLVGTSFDFHLTPKVTWSTTVNAGFGGSEGTYKAATSLAWSPASHWVIAPNASFTTTEFENGTIGDSDWYFYDSDDVTFGLAVMYLFF